MLKICKTDDISNMPFYIRLMSEIPLISKETAKKILNTYNIGDILNGKISRQNLENIPKSSKKRIGTKTISYIFKFFNIIDIKPEFKSSKKPKEPKKLKEPKSKISKES
jgi:hypothetical protein